MEKICVNPYCELMVIGGSAGSLEVIITALPQLRTGLPFAILIVLHRGSDPDPVLPSLLAAKTNIPVKEVEEKEPVRAGTIYIAPADYHLLIEKDLTFSLDYSEKVNFSRPSIDVTFEVAAEVYGNKLTCLLLSGGNTDGTGGLATVIKAGGLAVVQNPLSASVPMMPQHALSSLPINCVLNTEEVATFINNLRQH